MGKANAEHLEIHYTPKHGSWLDIAEIELSALGRRCIADNRIPDLPSLRALLKPWAAARNIAQKGVDWHFSTDDARIKVLDFLMDLWKGTNNKLKMVKCTMYSCCHRKLLAAKL